MSYIYYFSSSEFILSVVSQTVMYFQMLEVCSPVVSSTSHPEMKGMRGQGYSSMRPGPGSQGDNIGSIITMLIDDQGADLEDILTDSRTEDRGQCRERLEPGLQVSDRGKTASDS